ncbi:MAG: hypothetical protein NZ951_00265 [Dehalococcoidia bacterium]|nr:hypothetical protein [Dehalococcoidia bacterium]MDW8119079.1 hypothetical protein [Chloroflexota bacterium]
MTILITNTTIVTCDPARTILSNAALAVENDRLVALGPAGEVARAFPQAEVVDGRGRVVFPGLINCHAHLLLTVGRGIMDDFGFPSRLRFPSVPFPLRLPPGPLLGGLYPLKV